MDKIASIVILINEFIVVMQCMSIVFGKKLKPDLIMVIMLLFDVFIFMLMENGILHKEFTIFAYIFIFLYCYKKFKAKLLYTVIRFFAGIVLVGCVELVASVLVFSFRYLVESEETLLLLASIFALFLLCGFRVIVRLIVKIVSLHTRSSMVSYMLLLCVILFNVLIWSYLSGPSLIAVFIISLYSLIILLFIYFYRLKYVQSELEKKELALKMQKIYGGAYQELLTEVRKRQHDFKNQLGAMYSMYLTASSLEELVRMQTDYGNRLLDKCKFDGILTGCNNNILSGYLYYKCIDCENRGIIVQCDIKVEKAEVIVPLHEMIEMIGILITNACESYDRLNDDSRIIKLVLKEKMENLEITVSNLSAYIKSTEIANFFKEGYSTKGNDRGIGLARLKEVCTQYNADIIVFNDTIDDRNWICFRLLIKKQHE